MPRLAHVARVTLGASAKRSAGLSAETQHGMRLGHRPRNFAPSGQVASCGRWWSWSSQWVLMSMHLSSTWVVHEPGDQAKAAASMVTDCHVVLAVGIDIAVARHGEATGTEMLPTMRQQQRPQRRRCCRARLRAALTERRSVRESSFVASAFDYLPLMPPPEPFPPPPRLALLTRARTTHLLPSPGPRPHPAPQVENSLGLLALLKVGVKSLERRVPAHAEVSLTLLALTRASGHAGSVSGSGWIARGARTHAQRNAARQHSAPSPCRP